MEKKALRVLGFGIKNISKKEFPEEKDLIFLGLTGMIDPPRPEVKNAIKECREAGIQVKIITGDSALTAKAIGEKIGIVGRVVEELELKNMSTIFSKSSVIVVRFLCNVLFIIGLRQNFCIFGYMLMHLAKVSSNWSMFAGICT